MNNNDSAPPTLLSKLDSLFRLLTPFAFLLFFAGDLLRTYFSDDDFMNLYKYVETGWSTCRGLILFWSNDYYRPAGGFLYLSLYQLFGLHAVPFKLLVLVLLLLNLTIALFLFRALFRSTTLAALAGILIAYHAAETQLYYSFGTIYDIACFAFLYSALGLFIQVREQGKTPRGSLLLVLVLLQIAALDSKEMGVALPPILIAYEVIASPDARKRDFEPRAWIGPILLGFITLIYVVGKSTGSSALTQNLLYHPEISVHKYVASMAHYLDEIFYQEHVFTAKSTIILLGSGVVTSLLLRSRLMFFGWVWFLMAFLPLNFIPDRAGFVLYIPLVGLAVAVTAFASDLFVRLPHGMRNSSLARYAGPDGLVFFLIVALLLLRLDRREKFIQDSDEKRPLLVNQKFAADLASETPNPMPHAHLLFLNDPFSQDSWNTLFLPSLQRHDMKLSAARGRLNFLVLATDVLPQYDEIYNYDELHFTRISRAELPKRLAARRISEGFVEPGDGVWAAPAPYVWTKRAFTLRAGCAATQSACHLTNDIQLPREAYPTTPSHQLTVRVDGGPSQKVDLTTHQNDNLVSVALDGGPVHTLAYEFDAIVPAAEHPSDPRELGLVLRGAMITP